MNNNKSIGFLKITGPDPLIYYKATKPAFIAGPSSARQRNQAPFKWRFADGPMMARFEWLLDPLSSHQLY